MTVYVNSKENKCEIESTRLPSSVKDVKSCLQSPESAQELLTVFNQTDLNWTEENPLLFQRIISGIFLNERLIDKINSVFDVFKINSYFKKSLLSLLNKKEQVPTRSSLVSFFKNNPHKLLEIHELTFNLLNYLVREPFHSDLALLIDACCDQGIFEKYSTLTSQLLINIYKHDNDKLAALIFKKNVMFHSLFAGDSFTLKVIIDEMAVKCLKEFITHIKILSKESLSKMEISIFFSKFSYFNEKEEEKLNKAQEIVNILVANGLVVEFLDSEEEKVAQQTKKNAHELCELRNYLYAKEKQESCEPYLKKHLSQLVNWLIFDFQAPVIIKELPNFSDIILNTIPSLNKESRENFSFLLEVLEKADLCKVLQKNNILLLQAVKAGNSALVETLLQAKWYVDHDDSNSEMPVFQVALQSKDEAIISAFLKHPSMIKDHLSFPNGQTAIEVLISLPNQSTLALLKKLFNCGASLTHCLEFSLFEYICRQKTIDLSTVLICQELVKQGISLENKRSKDSILHLVCNLLQTPKSLSLELENSILTLIALLLTHRQKEQILHVIQDGLTPLEFCCLAGLTQVALLLLQAGANPQREMDAKAQTLLHNLAQSHLLDLTLCAALVAFGADPYLVDQHLKSPADISHQIAELARSMHIRNQWQPVISRIQEFENQNHVSILNNAAANVLKREIPQILEMSPVFGGPWVSHNLLFLLDIKAFGHLFGDALIRHMRDSVTGECLEGNLLSKSGNFLLELLELVKKKHENELASYIDLKQIEIVSQFLREAVQLAKALETTMQISDGKKLLFFLVKSTSLKISCLPPDQSLLLPAGWVGESDGHAVLIKITRNVDQTFELFVINTGAGIQHHLARSAELKNFVNPIFCFNKVTEAELLKSDFITALFSLYTHVPCEAGQKYSSADVYQALLKRFARKRVDLPLEKEKHFITPQRSGTCSLRCLLAYLHIELGQAQYKWLKTSLEFIALEAAFKDELSLPNSMTLKQFLEHVEKNLTWSLLKHQIASSFSNQAIEKHGLSTNPTTLELLDHAKKNLAQNILKHQIASSLPNQAIEKYSLILTKAQSYLEKLRSYMEENPVLLTDPLQPKLPSLSFIQSLSRLESQLEKVPAYSQEYSPADSIAFPDINFSNCNTAADLIEGLRALLNFASENRNNPLDKAQLATKYMLSHAINTLPLPVAGIFHEGIDQGTIWGLISEDQRIEILGLFKQLVPLFLGSFHKEKNAYVDQLLAFNRIYAISWRLCLVQTNRNFIDLQKYGIDTSQLKSLQQSTHLLAYEPELERQLSQLIEFFERSHPCVGEDKFTLLAFHKWTVDENRNWVLPIKDDLGEGSLFDTISADLPIEYWKKIDEQRDNLKVQNWKKPNQKDWRLASLWRESPNETIFSSHPYYFLREVGLYCWIAQSAKTCDIPMSPKLTLSPLQSCKGEDPQISVRLEIEKRSLSFLPPLSNAFHLSSRNGSNSHHHIMDNQISESLLHEVDQNIYILKEKKSYHPFFDIAKESNLSLPRLFFHYKQNISALKIQDQQVFFQLILFRKGELIKTIQENSENAKIILDIIDLGLYEFQIALNNIPHADSSAKELYQTMLFLYLNKIRLLDYLDTIINNGINRESYESIEKKMTQWLSSPPHKVLESGSLKQSLHLFYICLNKFCSKYENNKIILKKTLLHLFSASKWADISSDKVDPTLLHQALRVVCLHSSEIAILLKDVEFKTELVNEILSIHDFPIGEQKLHVEGTFPQFVCRDDQHIYEIHLLNGFIILDGIKTFTTDNLENDAKFKSIFEGRHFDSLKPVYSSKTLEAYQGKIGNESYRFTLIIEQKIRSDFFKNDITSNLIIEKEMKGGIFRYVPWEALLSDQKLILPVAPNEDYDLWLSDSHPSISAIIQEKKSGCHKLTFLRDKSLVNREGKEGLWSMSALETLSELQPLLRIEGAQSLIAYTSEEQSSVEAQCLRLTDGKGKMLEWQYSLSSNLQTSKISLASVPQYHISSQQTRKGLYNHPHYLTLENHKQQCKILLPVKVWSEIEDLEKVSCPPYKCEMIELNQDGYPTCKLPYQNLLLAYHFIGLKRYGEACSYLKKAEKLRVYQPEELKLLGWIFLHHKETHLRTPEANALRLLSAHLAQDNLKRHPGAYVSPTQKQTIQSFYDDSKKWVSFWQNAAYWKNSSLGEDLNKSLLDYYLANSFQTYYNNCSHLSSPFLLHSPVGKLSSFQEAEWIKSILNNHWRSSLFSRLEYLLNSNTEQQPHVQFYSEKNPVEPKLLNLDCFKQSIRLSHSASLDDLLDNTGRFRPSTIFFTHFDQFYAFAKGGSPLQKERLNLFLNDMQFDTDKVSQALCLILLSQCTPDLSNEDFQNISEKIAKEIEKIYKKTQRSSFQDKLFQSKESDSLANLNNLLKEFYCKQILIKKSLSVSFSFPPSPDISNLVPVLASKCKDKLNLAPFKVDDLDFPGLLSEIAAKYFQSEEQSPLLKSILSLPQVFEQDDYFYERHKSLEVDLKEGQILNFTVKKPDLNVNEFSLSLVAAWQNSLNNDERLKLKESALNCLHHMKKATFIKISEQIQKQIDCQKNRIKKIKTDITDLIQQVTGNEEYKLQARLMRLSEKYILPTLEECSFLFAQREMSLYRKRLPFLSEDDLVKLHQLLGSYFFHVTAQHQSLRCIGHIEVIIDKMQRITSTSSDYLDIKEINSLYLELLKKREYDPAVYPELMVLEFHANFSLRKNQCNNLIKLITKNEHGQFPNLGLQMIMDSGKTSVLGTLLALFKADGYHLSMLILPRALFDTNAPDLSLRTQEFFGQKGHVLTFGRSKEYFNLPYLQQLHNLLLSAITNREYIITTPETLQSMQNKYLEACENINSLEQKLKLHDQYLIINQKQTLKLEIQNWQVLAQKLKTILHIIRIRGVGTFDEMDTIFSPKKALNFPGINTVHLDPVSTEIISELFLIASTDPEIQALGLDLKANEQTRLLPKQYETLRPILAKKFIAFLLKNERWCRYLKLQPLQDNKQAIEFEEYLSNLNCSIPSWLEKLHTSFQEADRLAAERLVLMRQELLEWLPSAWKSAADEHYGRSRLYPEIEIAKPNIAANIPNESAEIADKWELINKTLQLYISKGLDLNQIRKMILKLQEKAKREWKAFGTAGSASTTETGKLFLQAMENQISLLDVDVKDEGNLRNVQSFLSQGSNASIKLTIQYLVEQVFPKVEIHTEQISNNSENLSTIVASAQGYSGTMENSYALPDVFSREEIIWDKGASGKVIDVLCRHNPLLHHLPGSCKTPKELLHSLLHLRSSKERNLFHALIDVGAYFKGQSNQEIARSILDYYSSLPDSPIQGVLYYDDETNLLAFLRRGREEMPVLLPSPDLTTIKRLTGLKSNQLFTFYDQFHTIGSDLKQDPQAKAFYTIGDHTTLRDLLQAVMRMREFFRDQRLEGILPEKLLPLLKSKTECSSATLPTIEEVILFCEINGHVKSREENLKAYLQKLQNVIRTHVLDKLYNLKDPELEQVLYKSARPFFVKSLEEQLYLSYASIPTEISCQAFLEDQLREMLKILNILNTFFTPVENENIERELKEITAAAKDHLPPQVSSLLQNQDSTVENIQETEKKQTKLNEVEVELEQENLHQIDHDLSPAKERAWETGKGKELLEQFTIHSYPIEAADHPTVWRLSEVLFSLPEFQQFASCFGKEILVSSNFLKTVKNQANLFEANQKNTYEVLLFCPLGAANSRHALIISTAEAGQFCSFLRENKTPFSLFEANGYWVAGNLLPEDSPGLNILLLQLLFFSGRVQELQNIKFKDSLQVYLQDQREKKRDFFEKVLLNEQQLSEYFGSELENLLNTPDISDEKREDLLIASLKHAASDALRGHFIEAKERIKKFTDNLPVEKPQVITASLEIAVKMMLQAQNTGQKDCGYQLFLGLLPFWKDSSASFSILLDSLKQPLSIEIKYQIANFFLTHSLCNTETLEQAALLLQLCINSETSPQEVKETFRCSLDLLLKSREKSGISSYSNEWRQTLITNFSRNETITFEIIDLMRKYIKEDNALGFEFLEEVAVPFITKWITLQRDHWHPFSGRGATEKSFIMPQTFFSLKQFYDISEKVNKIVESLALDWMLQSCYEPLQWDHAQNKVIYSKTKPSRDARILLAALLKSDILYGIEKAENLQLFLYPT